MRSGEITYPSYRVAPELLSLLFKSFVTMVILTILVASRGPFLLSE